MPDDSFFASRPKMQLSLVGVPSGSLPRSPASFSFSNVSLQIIIRSPHPGLGKFVFSDPKEFCNKIGTKQTCRNLLLRDERTWLRRGSRSGYDPKRVWPASRAGGCMALGRSSRPSGSARIRVVGRRRRFRPSGQGAPDPPDYPRLLWATRRRFDPSSSPSAT
jgi:hypothetical protein